MPDNKTGPPEPFLNHSARLFPNPVEADAFFSIAVSEIKLSLIGIIQGLANPPGQMDAGGGYNGALLFLGNGHEPLHGMRFFLLGFQVVD